MRERICIKAEIMKHIDRLRESPLDVKSAAVRHLTTTFRMDVNDMTESQCVEALFKYIEFQAEELLRQNELLGKALRFQPMNFVIRPDGIDPALLGTDPQNDNYAAAVSAAPARKAVSP